MNVADALARLKCVRPCAGVHVACCPAHDDQHPSLSIREENGEARFHCFKGCSYCAIITALGDQPRLRAFGFPSASPTLVSRRTSKPSAPGDAERTASALRIWRATKPATGTLVESYLHARAITLAIPPSLRFHGGLKHPTGIDLPAMVAAVQNMDGAIVAIHRTFLKKDGSGKANVQPNKMMLGPCAGGAVRFAKPASIIAIAEGIETALSIAQACPHLAVWAALSAAGIRALQLPESVQEVIICADNDPDGTGERAAETAAARFVKQGKRVRIAKPHGAKDFTDLNEGQMRLIIGEGEIGK
jgi:putative DNA primase/helicase